MVEGYGLAVSNCPLGLKICYPSCYWWSNTCCKYPSLAQRKHDEDLKALRESSKIRG